jgi:hypothetical protein
VILIVVGSMSVDSYVPRSVRYLDESSCGLWQEATTISFHLPEGSRAGSHIFVRGSILCGLFIIWLERLHAISV